MLKVLGVMWGGWEQVDIVGCGEVGSMVFLKLTENGGARRRKRKWPRRWGCGTCSATPIFELLTV